MSDRFLVLRCRPHDEGTDYVARRPPNWPPSVYGGGAWMASVAELTCPARIGVCAAAMAMSVEGGAAEVALASTEIIRSPTHLVNLLNARLAKVSPPPAVRRRREVEPPAARAPPGGAAPPGRSSSSSEEAEAGADVRAARSAARHIAPREPWQLTIVKSDAGLVRANFSARLTDNLAQMFDGVAEIGPGRTYRLTVRADVVCIVAPGLVRDTSAMAVDERAGEPLLRTLHYPPSAAYAKGGDRLLIRFAADARFVAVEGGGGGHSQFRIGFRNELHQPLHFTPRVLPVVVTLRLRASR